MVYMVQIVSDAGFSMLVILHFWLCSPAQAMASLFTRFRYHTQRRATVGRTPLDE
jgi:hypothetical protein